MFEIAKLMQKKAHAYLPKNQQYNISDEDDERVHIETHLFPSKFIKELNFQQNCQKSRQRRIKKINQLFYLKGTVLETLINEKEKQRSSKQMKAPSSDNLKEIYYKGNIIKGRLKKKMLHGDTEIIYENGAEFKGVFKNGKMRTGKFDFKNGYEYWGQLEGKKFIGKGTLKCPNGTRITGVWNGDQISGRAQIEYFTGDVYYGETKHFKKHGEGYLFFKSGNKYIGRFQHGQMTGFGTYFNTDGTSVKGQWKNGQLIQRKEDSGIDIKSSKNSQKRLPPNQQDQQPNPAVQIPQISEDCLQGGFDTLSDEQEEGQYSY